MATGAPAAASRIQLRDPDVGVARELAETGRDLGLRAREQTPAAAQGRANRFRHRAVRVVQARRRPPNAAATGATGARTMEMPSPLVTPVGGLTRSM